MKILPSSWAEHLNKWVKKKQNGSIRAEGKLFAQYTLGEIRYLYAEHVLNMNLVTCVKSHLSVTG